MPEFNDTIVIFIGNVGAEFSVGGDLLLMMFMVSINRWSTNRWSRNRWSNKLLQQKSSNQFIVGARNIVGATKPEINCRSKIFG